MSAWATSKDNFALSCWPSEKDRSVFWQWFRIAITTPLHFTVQKMVHFDFWEHRLGGHWPASTFLGHFCDCAFHFQFRKMQWEKQILVLSSKFRPLNSLNMGLEIFGPCLSLIICGTKRVILAVRPTEHTNLGNSSWYQDYSHLFWEQEYWSKQSLSVGFHHECRFRKC